MATPRLDRPSDDRAYLIDADGVRWRIHDCAFEPQFAEPHHRKRLPFEAPGMNTRYFVNAAGARRAYTLKHDESRRLTLDDCARQFAEAGYCRRGASISGADDSDRVVCRQICYVLT